MQCPLSTGPMCCTHINYPPSLYTFIQLNEVMEKETYKTARELLERFDPTNPSLQVTPARPQRANRAPQSELRQRNRQTPHPALMQHRAAMATPQAPRPAPVAMTTPAVQTSSSNQEAAPVEPLPTPQPSLHHIPPGAS